MCCYKCHVAAAPLTDSCSQKLFQANITPWQHKGQIECKCSKTTHKRGSTTTTKTMQLLVHTLQHVLHDCCTVTGGKHKKRHAQAQIKTHMHAHTACLMHTHIETTGMLRGYKNTSQAGGECPTQSVAGCTHQAQSTKPVSQATTHATSTYANAIHTLQRLVVQCCLLTHTKRPAGVRAVRGSGGVASMNTKCMPHRRS